MSQVTAGVALALIALGACGHPAREAPRAPQPAAPSAALTAARDLTRRGCECATLDCADAALQDLTSALASPPVAGESARLLAATRELLACRERLAHPEEPADMDGAIGDGGLSNPDPDPEPGSGAGSSGTSPD